MIDTHIHADHITGLNELSKIYNCSKIMGEQSKSEVIDVRVKNEDKIKIENIELNVIYTPGHTDCSYSFLMIRRPPRSTHCISSAASDVYKRQAFITCN